jgi:hypothetical protein
MPKSAKADALRRRIALYRDYLREGVSASLAKDYLKEIAKAEAALAALNENGKKKNADLDR